jgi:GMP synthase (glutamine-hydrolysing)
MKNREDLKILLLQVRKDPVVKFEEHVAFAKYAKLSMDQVISYDVYNENKLPSNILKYFDALFIGGTSDANVLFPDKNPFLEAWYPILNNCREDSTPVFASCFGFQMAIIALGGEILHQEDNFEMGTLPIQLSEIAKSDPLFSKVPSPFYAVSVHKQKAIELPSSCELLAYTDQCIHGFKIKNKPFWGFQFHPEVNKQTLVNRLGIYQSQYTNNPEHYNKIINEAQETPHSNFLVKYFIDHILTL